jgi:putative sterol carrier protein
LERTAGTDAGLRLLFAAMARAYTPEGAGGFDGELQYDLRRSDGRVARWTLRAAPSGAAARQGPAGAPALVLRMTVADFVRMAGGDLDAGKALLTGRLDLEGDFDVAGRLGDMFGRTSAL